MGERAAAVAAACESIGFFRLPLDVIDRGVAEAAWNAASEFFALDEEEKRRVEFPEPGYPYGYSPFKYETLAKSLDDGSPSGPDLRESFSVGPDCSGVDVGDSSHLWIRSPSIWPEQPIGFKVAWTAYYRALTSVAEDLMATMSVALGMPEDHFAPLIDRPITSMRALYYPALVAPASAATARSLRAGAHSDYGTLTILRTDDISGLQIRSAEGAWVDVAPEPDTFVVNLGDSIAQWTNDRWPSTVHRVAITDDRARQSFAFFHMANWDSTIQCLPTCLEAGSSPRHAPVQAGPWLMRKFKATVT